MLFTDSKLIGGNPAIGLTIDGGDTFVTTGGGGKSTVGIGANLTGLLGNPCKDGILADVTGAVVGLGVVVGVGNPGNAGRFDIGETGTATGLVGNISSTITVGNLICDGLDGSGTLIDPETGLVGNTNPPIDGPGKDEIGKTGSAEPVVPDVAVVGKLGKTGSCVGLVTTGLSAPA